MDFFEQLSEQLSRLDQWTRSLEPLAYRNMVRSVVAFMRDTPHLRAELDALAARARSWDRAALEAAIADGSDKRLLYSQPTLERQTALAWEIWGLLDVKTAEDPRRHFGDMLKHAVSNPDHGVGGTASGPVRDSLHALLVSPLIVYLQCVVGRRLAEEHALLRYKARVEWFQRERVAALLAGGDSRRKEVRAQRHLYEHLFDAGLPFVLEASSPSGNLDFMLLQPEGRRLCAEVKVYDGSRSRAKTHVLGGYKQVLCYMSDHCAQRGYLLLLNDSKHEVVTVGLDTSSRIPALVSGGTWVHVLVIQIGQLDGSASRRVRRKRVELSLEDFLGAKTLPASASLPVR